MRGLAQSSRDSRDSRDLPPVMSGLSAFLRPGENEDALEHIMQTEKVTLPVARNLLKMRQLGVGLGLTSVPRGNPPQPGEKRDRRGNRSRSRSRDSDGFMDREAVERKRKAKAIAFQRQLEKQEEDEEEEREREREDKLREEKRRKRNMGFQSLGPVMARDVQVDPLQIKLLDKTPPPQVQEEEEDESEPEDEVVKRAKARANEVPARIHKESQRREEDPKKSHYDRTREEDPKKSRHDRTLRLEAALQSRNSDLPPDVDARRDARHSRKQSPPISTKKRFASSASESPGPEEHGSSDLMSEAQIVAMMRKNKKNVGSSRGSTRAKGRLQRELKEWEIAKSKNQEIWKPPKHCLVIGAAERKSRRA